MASDPVASRNPPKFTRLTGEALWFAVLNRYELEQHELLILREIVRCVDDLDRLANITGRQGAVTASGGVHPALAEARQMRITLATLIGALRLPDEKEEDQAALRRPRRRPAVRSVDPLPPPQELPLPRPQERRAVVRSSEGAIRQQAPCAAVVPGIDLPTPSPADRRHFADARAAAASRQISVAQLLENARTGGAAAP